MNPYTGTRTLTRLALRLDRVRITAWILVIGLLPAITAAQYRQLYPTTASLSQVTGVVNSSSLVAINGPLFGSDSIGGLTAWKITVTELILVALMAILTVIRHSRAEEESGRLEVIGSGVVGRLAPLTAALATAGAAAMAAGVLATVGLLGAGQPAAGSVAMGTAIAATGLLFAAVAGVTAQVTESARSAIAMACAVLGIFYVLRAVGDTGPTAVSWASPIGWAMRIRPFAHERWWTLLPGLALTVVAVTVAYALAGRRDHGAGLLPQRPGPAYASSGLRGTFGLAWRLHRGLLLGWIVGMAIWGAVLGGSAKSIGDAKITNQQMLDVLTRLGGHKALVDTYLAATLGITGIIAAAYTVQATLRMRGEETAGRLEPLLSTPATRVRWALSHLVFAVAGTTLVLAVTGLFAGLSYGTQIHDTGGQVTRLLAGALVQAPAAWVLAGVGAALFGLVPRLSSLTWAALAACLLVLELGEVLGLNRRVLDVSPFAHVPKLPGSAFTAAPIVWLTLATLALGVAGLAGFRRRDIG